MLGGWTSCHRAVELIFVNRTSCCRVPDCFLHGAAALESISRHLFSYRAIQAIHIAEAAVGEPVIGHRLVRVDTKGLGHCLAHVFRCRSGHFLGIAANQQGNMVLPTLSEHYRRVRGHVPTVHRRAHVGRVLFRRRRGSLLQLLGGKPTQELDLRGTSRRPQADGEAGARLFGILERGHGIAWSALLDGPMQQSSGLWRSDQQPGVPAARRLTEYGNVFGIAAESGDIVMHPFQGCELVKQAVIAGSTMWRFCRQLGMHEESEKPQAETDGDHNNAPARQRRAVEVVGRGPSGPVTAAEYPEHYRLPGLCRPIWRPDVQVQAIFVVSRCRLAVSVPDFLDTSGTECVCVAHALPRLDRLRLTPA